MNRKDSGSASTSTANPRTAQVTRQLVACSRYIANGTNRKPPKEVPAELKATAVALLRRTHLDSKAMVLVKKGPLRAVDSTKLNTKIRNRMWKVKLRAKVASPIITRPTRITRRPPNRSNKWPMKG